MNTLQSSVDFLNRALQKDREAITALLFKRVPCNTDLADDKDVVVRDDGGQVSVSTLGFVNGLISHLTGGGRICVHVDDNGHVQEFSQYESPDTHQ